MAENDAPRTLDSANLQERAKREEAAYNDLVTVKIPQAQAHLQSLEQERLQRLGKIVAFQELLQEVDSEASAPPGETAEVPAEVAHANGHSVEAAQQVGSSAPRRPPGKQPPLPPRKAAAKKRQK